MDTIKKKHEALLKRLKGYQDVTVAFSGGVDSVYLAYAAREALGDKALALTVDSAFMPRSEIEECKALAEQIGIEHRIISADVLSVGDVVQNPKDRCYHCKKVIMGLILKSARGRVIDGSNADDAKDYRPGELALRQLEIASPLKDEGLAKADIRALSKLCGLPTHDKPSYACLASRIPCGVTITKEQLGMVERAENALHGMGFLRVRVRHHGDIARIECQEMERFVKDADFDAVDRALKEAGFKYVTLDLHGYTLSGLA